jgi:hypothetical protein
MLSIQILKTGKKGVEPLTFDFGNHYSTTELFTFTLK